MSHLASKGREWILFGLEHPGMDSCLRPSWKDNVAQFAVLDWAGITTSSNPTTSSILPFCFQGQAFLGTSLKYHIKAWYSVTVWDLLPGWAFHLSLWPHIGEGLRTHWPYMPLPCELPGEFIPPRTHSCPARKLYLLRAFGESLGDASFWLDPTVFGRPRSGRMTWRIMLYDAKQDSQQRQHILHILAGSKRLWSL